jgi:hypothetical protein
MTVAILQQTDDLAAYVAEILLAWGVMDHRLYSAAEVANLGPAAAPVLICPRADISAGVQGKLIGYARRGGTLIVFMPAGELAAAAGLCPLGTMGTPLRLRLTGTPAAGLDGELLPIVGRASAYEVSAAQSVTGYLSVPGQYEGESPGIAAAALGAGRIIALAFDLPLSVLLLRQGDPARAEQLPAGDPCPRPSHLAAQFDAGDAAWVPFADLLGRWLVDEVRRWLPAPLPLMWHLPAGAPGILLYSGDEDDADVAWNLDEMTYLHSQDACMNLYIMPEQTHSTRADVARYAEHHGVGPHPNLRPLDGAPVSVRMAEFARQITLFEEQFGVKARSLRNHCTAWAGYLEPVELMSRLGVGMDGNYFSGAFMRDRVQAPYAAFGAAMPMRFCHPAGTLLPVFQQHTPLADDVLFGPDYYSYKLSPAAFGAMSARIFDDMVRRFHTPYAVCIHPSNWVRFSGEQGRTLIADARCRGVPVWSFDRWLEFCQARFSWRGSMMGWHGNRLEWEAQGELDHAQLCLAIPQDHGGLRLCELEVDDHSCSWETVSRYRSSWAMLPVPSGSRHVRISAQYG